MKKKVVEYDQYFIWHIEVDYNLLYQKVVELLRLFFSLNAE